MNTTLPIQILPAHAQPRSNAAAPGAEGAPAGPFDAIFAASTDATAPVAADATHEPKPPVQAVKPTATADDASKDEAEVSHIAVAIGAASAQPPMTIDDGLVPLAAPAAEVAPTEADPNAPPTTDAAPGNLAALAQTAPAAIAGFGAGTPSAEPQSPADAPPPPADPAATIVASRMQPTRARFGARHEDDRTSAADRDTDQPTFGWTTGRAGRSPHAAATPTPPAAPAPAVGAPAAPAAIAEAPASDAQPSPEPPAPGQPDATPPSGVAHPEVPDTTPKVATAADFEASQDADAPRASITPASPATPHVVRGADGARDVAREATPVAGAERFDRILDQLRGEIQAGRNEFRLRLDPRELGRLDVRIVARGDGVAVHVTTERADVANFLRTDIPALHRCVERDGVQVVSVDVHSTADFNAGRGADPQDRDGADAPAARDIPFAPASPRRASSALTLARAHGAASTSVDLIV